MVHHLINIKRKDIILIDQLHLTVIHITKRGYITLIGISLRLLKVVVVITNQEEVDLLVLKRQDTVKMVVRVNQNIEVITIMKVRLQREKDQDHVQERIQVDIQKDHVQGQGQVQDHPLNTRRVSLVGPGLDLVIEDLLHGLQEIIIDLGLNDLVLKVLITEGVLVRKVVVRVKDHVEIEESYFIIDT